MLARNPIYRPATRLPKAPSWLSKFAREEWKAVASPIHERGMLTPELRGIVASYCSALGTIRECELKIAEDGMLINGVHGMRRAHPLLASKSQAMSTAGALAKKMGLFDEFATAMADEYADLGVR